MCSSARLVRARVGLCCGGAAGALSTVLTGQQGSPPLQHPAMAPAGWSELFPFRQAGSLVVLTNICQQAQEDAFICCQVVVPQCRCKVQPFCSGCRPWPLVWASSISAVRLQQAFALAGQMPALGFLFHSNAPLRCQQPTLAPACSPFACSSWPAVGPNAAVLTTPPRTQIDHQID